MNFLHNHIQTQQEVIKGSACEKSDCCRTTEDGRSVCTIPDNAKADNTAATIRIGSIEIIEVTSAQPKLIVRKIPLPHASLWQKIRGVMMFGIACLASPCCTPLIVPVVLALLAGTPAALWIGQNLGWVYGGLTVLSLVSFVLGRRWMGKNNRRTPVSRVQSPVPSKVSVK